MDCTQGPSVEELDSLTPPSVCATSPEQLLVSAETGSFVSESHNTKSRTAAAWPLHSASITTSAQKKTCHCIRFKVALAGSRTNAGRLWCTRLCCWKSRLPPSLSARKQTSGTCCLSYQAFFCLPLKTHAQKSQLCSCTATRSTLRNGERRC